VSDLDLAAWALYARMVLLEEEMRACRVRLVASSNAILLSAASAREAVEALPGVEADPRTTGRDSATDRRASAP